jgi:hypothetical protein
VLFSSGNNSDAAKNAIANTIINELIIDLFWKIDSRNGKP